jgi:hypothetical protein
MPAFSRGQVVQILCEVRPGPFPGEHLVTFESADGPISGFVRDDDFRAAGEQRGYVLATVTDVSEHTLTAMVRGSFFSTNGLASFQREWANSHVREARA